MFYGRVVLNCNNKINCPHVRLGPVGRMPSVDILCKELNKPHISTTASLKSIAMLSCFM